MCSIEVAPQATLRRSSSNDAVPNGSRVSKKPGAIQSWQRPKGMRSTTYRRIIGAILDCEEAREVALSSYMHRHAMALGLKL